MKRNLNEVLIQAIINKEPAVLVEGKDDRMLYERIAEQVDIPIKIWQIEYIEGYAEGCIHVIKAIEKLQVKFEENSLNIKYIVGIIDKDVRQFTSKLPNLKGLFVTKYYSIETYFATSNNLAKLINHITYLSRSEINSKLIEYIETEHKQNLNNLFLISLEALQNTCNTDYNAVVRFSEKASNVVKNESKKDQIILPALKIKQAQLFDFAIQKKISIRDIKLICKGKWYLYNYIYFALQTIKKLPADCENNIIQQCDACKIDKYQNCHYKTSLKNYKTEQLTEQIKNFVDKEECSDIINLFKSMNYKNN